MSFYDDTNDNDMFDDTDFENDGEEVSIRKLMKIIDKEEERARKTYNKKLSSTEYLED